MESSLSADMGALSLTDPPSEIEKLTEALQKGEKTLDYAKTDELKKILNAEYDEEIEKMEQVDISEKALEIQQKLEQLEEFVTSCVLPGIYRHPVSCPDWLDLETFVAPEGAHIDELNPDNTDLDVSDDDDGAPSKKKIKMEIESDVEDQDGDVDMDVKPMVKLTGVKSTRASSTKAKPTKVESVRFRITRSQSTSVKLKAKTSTKVIKARTTKAKTKVTKVVKKELYCVCRDVAWGTMVQCTYTNCEFDWFHYPCVHLTTAPKGDWFCSSDCQQKHLVSVKKTRDVQENDSDWKYKNND